MVEGLVPAHHGLVYNGRSRILFSPGQAALAQLALMSKKDISDLVQETAERMQEDEHTRRKLPQIAQAQAEELFNLEHLRDLAKKHYGSAKLIDSTALGKEVRLTDKHDLIGEVSSRRLAREQAPYIIKVDGAVFEDEPREFNVTGASTYHTMNSRRSTHWSKGIPHERIFLEILAQQTSKDMLSEHEKKLELVDYHPSIVLAQLDQDVRAGRQGIPAGYVTAQAFDFTGKEELLLESYLAGHTSKARRGEAGDRALFGQRILTPAFQDLLKKGTLSKGSSLTSSKHFTDYSWAIIQALEFSAGQEGFRFTGHGMEFPTRSFGGISISYDKPQQSRRIIYDDELGQAYLVEKNFSPRGEFPSRYLPQEWDARKMVNFESQDRDSISFRETDYRSGRLAEVTIREPNAYERSLAVEFSRNGGRGLSGWDIRKRYIDSATGQ